MYVVQPLGDGVSSFCLTCLGTNNKFDYHAILMHWKYIVSELSKQNIKVVNFSSDGDSRLLKAMLIMLSLQKESSFNPNTILPSEIELPCEWTEWFKLPRLPLFSVVQDTVHLGIKLKARLMKPRTILPMGTYVASATDLRIIFESFGKEVHNLRIKDLDHKNRQNSDAVTHLTSDSVSNLLVCCGYIGTKVYLTLIRYVINSFLCKDLKPQERVSRLWAAAFFFRYWQQWILDNSQYNLKDNFITRNAYVCTEINGHCLITFLLVCKSENIPFKPWLLGSQPCEKLFCTARSMSSVYSTVINFSILGLLQRLHRIHIQNIIEAEGEENGIVFPHREKHFKHIALLKCWKYKTRYKDVSSVNIEDIKCWIKLGRDKAKTFWVWICRNIINTGKRPPLVLVQWN